MTIDPELEAERDGLNNYPVAFLQHLIDNGEGWQSEGALEGLEHPAPAWMHDNPIEIIQRHFNQPKVRNWEPYAPS